MKILSSAIAFMSFTIAGCAVTDDMQDISPAYSAEIQDAADRYNIQQLIYRYSLAIDLTDPEAYAEVFTNDGEILLMGETRLAKGRDEIMALAEGDRERFNPGAKDGERSFMIMRSVLSNPVVTLNGDGTASGISYIQIVVNKPEVGPVILGQGRYVDEYVKQTDGWKVSKRSIYATDMANFEVAVELGIAGG